MLNVKKDSERALASLAEVHTIRDFVISNLNSIRDTIVENKTFIAKAPALLEFFKKAQQSEYAKKLKIVESLLNAAIADVLPQIIANYRLELVLSTDTTNPELDLYLVSITDPDHVEDVYEDNGGALTNVLSGALQFIGVTASPAHRRFIAGDEIDCWLSPMRIPSFNNMLAKVAGMLDFQFLCISHHNAQDFYPDCARFILSDSGELKKVKAGLEWSSGQKGIRRIILTDIKKHKYLDIPLSPGVNVLTGDNNAGKSVITGALRAFAHGSGKDSLIRHGAKRGSIEVYFDETKKITMTRNRTGSPKTVYQMEELDSSGKWITTRKPESGERGSCPEWVKSELGLYRQTDKLDAQLRPQKSPVFLLGDSGAERAKILSVGQDHVVLSNAQKLLKADAKSAEASVQSLDQIYLKATEVLTNVENPIILLDLSLPDLHSSILKTSENLEKTEEDALKLKNLIAALDTIALIESKLKNLSEIDSPELTDTDADLENLSSLACLGQAIKLSANLTYPLEPLELFDTDRDSTNLNSMLKLAEATKAAGKLTIPAEPLELADTTADLENLESMYYLSKAMSIHANLTVPSESLELTDMTADNKSLSDLTILSEEQIPSLERELKLNSDNSISIGKEISDIISSLDDNCPTCGSGNFKQNIALKLSLRT